MLSSELKATLDIFRPYLYMAVGDLSKALDSSIFSEYLMQLHHVVRASVPLMNLAKSLIEPNTHSDHMVSAYLSHHCAEEAGHDEWIEQDLAELGVVDRLCNLPSVSAARLVGEAYYLIRFHSPMAILGYIAAIECNPPSDRFVERMSCATSGLGVRAIKEHSEVDIEHSQKLFELLQSIRLSEFQHEAILYCARRTMINTIEFIREALPVTDS